VSQAAAIDVTVRRLVTESVNEMMMIRAHKQQSELMGDRAEQRHLLEVVVAPPLSTSTPTKQQRQSQNVHSLSYEAL